MMKRYAVLAGIMACALSACGGGGGGGNNPSAINDPPPPSGSSVFDDDEIFEGISLAGSCDVRFIAGINSDGTAFFEMDKRNLYVVNSPCLFGNDEIHVAESTMLAVSETMEETRDSLTSTDDIEIGDCTWEVKGTFQFAEQKSTILFTTPLVLEDSICGQDLFSYAIAFDQILIIAVQDAVLGQHPDFADGDVGRITFDFLQSKITHVE